MRYIPAIAPVDPDVPARIDNDDLRRNRPDDEYISSVAPVLEHRHFSEAVNLYVQASYGRGCDSIPILCVKVGDVRCWGSHLHHMGLGLSVIPVAVYRPRVTRDLRRWCVDGHRRAGVKPLEMWSRPLPGVYLNEQPLRVARDVQEVLGHEVRRVCGGRIAEYRFRVRSACAPIVPTIPHPRGRRLVLR